MYSPVFLLSLYGVALKCTRTGLSPLDKSILLVILCHWLIISAFPVWWGGHSFGPRLFSDVVPYLCYFVIPVLDVISKSVGIRNFASIAVSVVLVGTSFMIHFRGATCHACRDWNNFPTEAERSLQDRLWDWQDPQFLRGIGGKTR